MIPRHHLAVIFAAVAAVVGKAAPIDSERLLECIAQIEGNDTRKIGAAGERSRYQITRSVWYKHTVLHFYNASSTEPEMLAEQHRVAEAHLRQLMLLVERPSVYRLALAWNAGIAATNSNNVSTAQASYASRARNLYNSEP